MYTHTHIYIYTHVPVYIYIYIYICMYRLSFCIIIAIFHDELPHLAPGACRLCTTAQDTAGDAPGAMTTAVVRCVHMDILWYIYIFEYI